jgi:hypothetical protein
MTQKRSDQCAFTHAISPEQAHGLTALNLDINAVQHMA